MATKQVQNTYGNYSVIKIKKKYIVFGIPNKEKIFKGKSNLCADAPTDTCNHKKDGIPLPLKWGQRHHCRMCGLQKCSGCIGQKRKDVKFCYFIRTKQRSKLGGGNGDSKNNGFDTIHEKFEKLGKLKHDQRDERFTTEYLQEVKDFAEYVANYELNDLWLTQPPSDHQRSLMDLIPSLGGGTVWNWKNAIIFLERELREINEKSPILLKIIIAKIKFILREIEMNNRDQGGKRGENRSLIVPQGNLEYLNGELARSFTKSEELAREISNYEPTNTENDILDEATKYLLKRKEQVIRNYAEIQTHQSESDAKIIQENILEEETQDLKFKCEAVHWICNSCYAMVTQKGNMTSDFYNVPVKSENRDQQASKAQILTALQRGGKKSRKYRRKKSKRKKSKRKKKTKRRRRKLNRRR